MARGTYRIQRGLGGAFPAEFDVSAGAGFCGGELAVNDREPCLAALDVVKGETQVSVAGEPAGWTSDGDQAGHLGAFRKEDLFAIRHEEWVSEDACDGRAAVVGSEIDGREKSCRNHPGRRPVEVASGSGVGWVP
jgi:hypothetical protein